VRASWLVITMFMALRGESLAQQTHRPRIVRSIKPEKSRDLKLEQVVLQKVDPREDARAPTFYNYDRVDLNNDGIPEVLVHVVGPDWCGSGGCHTFIFRKRENDYDLVSEIGLTGTPIMVNRIRSHGWLDLIVFVVGGGIQPGYYAVLSFDGHSYPENPSVPPARPLNHNAACVAYLSGDDTEGFQLTSPK
jgi:hypothetical protein